MNATIRAGWCSSPHGWSSKMPIYLFPPPASRKLPPRDRGWHYAAPDQIPDIGASKSRRREIHHAFAVRLPIERWASTKVNMRHRLGIRMILSPFPVVCGKGDTKPDLGGARATHRYQPFQVVNAAREIKTRLERLLFNLPTPILVFPSFDGFWPKFPICETRFAWFSRKPESASRATLIEILSNPNGCPLAHLRSWLSSPSLIAIASCAMLPCNR